MSRWALVAGGVVFTVVEQAAQPNVAPYTGVNVDAQPLVSSGWLYDGANFTAPVLWGWMRSHEFLRQFNRGDRKTIKDSADNIVADAMWQLQVSGLIDFSDPDMQGFMDQLVTLGVISNSKRNRIYAAARFGSTPGA